MNMSYTYSVYTHFGAQQGSSSTLKVTHPVLALITLSLRPQGRPGHCMEVYDCICTSKMRCTIRIG